MKEEAADHVGCGANDSIDPAVMGRSVRAREAQLNVVGEEGARGGVVELAAIIRLEGTDRATELVETQAKKWVRVEKVSDLRRKGKVQRK